MIEAIVHESAPVGEIWRERAFCRLDDGVVPVDRVLERLCETG